MNVCIYIYIETEQVAEFNENSGKMAVCVIMLVLFALKSRQPVFACERGG